MTGLPSSDDIIEMLRGVVDPELGSDIVELGMAKGATVGEDGLVRVTVALTTSGCPLRAQIQKDIRARVGGLPGVTKVKIDWTELTAEEKAATMAKARFNVQNSDAPETNVPPTAKVVMIASGKGGVGKSSITVNLAAGLASRGYTVGVMDADIWGFSVPRMLGVDGDLVANDKQIVPLERKIGDGLLRVVSMGHLVADEQTALMWRGLMLNRAVQHFIEDVQWGEDCDYVLIDMPPGTGDVQMGVAKLLPRAEMIIVTTPAKAAQNVASRVAQMGRSYYLRIAGVIENMSAFVANDGTSYEIFGAGGGEELATEIGVPLLGKVPIDGAVASGGDEGEPVILGSGPAADELNAIVDALVNEIVPPVEMAGCSARMFEAIEAALDELDAEEAAAAAAATDPA